MCERVYGGWTLTDVYLGRGAVCGCGWYAAVGADVGVSFGVGVRRGMDVV